MKNKLVCILFACVFIFLSAIPVCANAAEPPCFVILVNNAPEDLSITFSLGEGYEDFLLDRQKQAWESYYRCEYYALPDAARDDPTIICGGKINVQSEKEDVNFSVSVPENFLEKYNNIFQLDLKNGTLTEANTAGRTVLLISLRIALTLLIEGLILLLFRFHEKRTWIVFLLLNLITQSFLNFSISDVIPYNGYWFFAFVAIEVIIIPVEMLVYACLMREKKWYHRLLTALIANLASLLLGGWLLSNLPI